MTDALRHRFQKAERTALLLAALGAIASAALAFMHPSDFGFGYRFAALTWFAPSAGCLIFLLVLRSTGGQWAESLQPFLVIGARMLPWAWLLVLPALWLAPPRPPAVEAGQHLLAAYVSSTGNVIRAVVYLVIFFVFWWLCRPERTVIAPKNPDATESQVADADRPPTVILARGAAYRWFGPVGLIVLAFLLHLVAVDWIFSLEPGWYATSFPLVWMTGQAVAGLAISVLCAMALGANPAELGKQQRPLGRDWGNLLLTGTVFWTYVGFMQFLIIWNGNEPREISWYVHRSQAGWIIVLVVLAFVHIAIPFFSLLSRRVKESTRGLATVAALLLLAQLLYNAWMMLPARPFTLTGLALDVSLLVLGGGLFVNRAFAGVKRCLSPS